MEKVPDKSPFLNRIKVSDITANVAIELIKIKQKKPLRVSHAVSCHNDILPDTSSSKNVDSIC